MKGIKKNTKTELIIKLVAWALPFTIIGFIFYFNFTPLGYEKTFIINAGEEDDTKGDFYLEESSDLGSRQIIDNENLRYLDGQVYAVYEPKPVLKDAKIKAELKGDGVSFILPPETEDLKWDYNWDYKELNKNFSIISNEKNIYKRFINEEKLDKGDNLSINPKDKFAIYVEWSSTANSEILKGDISLTQTPLELKLEYKDIKINYPLPDFFIGKEQSALIVFKKQKLYLFLSENEFKKEALPENINPDKKITVKKGANADFLSFLLEAKLALAKKNNCAYFDGKTKLILPDTADQFEKGPFAIYLKWIPEKKEDRQELIGHYNWEIYQNKENVRFQVGRMATSTGPFYNLEHELENEYLYKEQSLLAIYNPSNSEDKEGYIELFVNNNFAGRQNFKNEFIWNDYNQEKDLSLGWSPHNYRKNPYLKGSICEAKFIYKELEPKKIKSQEFISNKEIIKMPIGGNGILKEVKIEIKQ